LDAFGEGFDQPLRDHQLNLSGLHLFELRFGNTLLQGQEVFSGYSFCLLNKVQQFELAKSVEGIGLFGISL